MLIDGATVDLEQENQRLQAELRVQTQELRGSRARLVAVGDAERKAPADSELAQMLETAAYFAVSEALANVVKHAGAGTCVHVEIPLSRPALPAPCRRFLRGG
jgi:signal transduction histidine kinase